MIEKRETKRNQPNEIENDSRRSSERIRNDKRLTFKREPNGWGRRRYEATIKDRIETEQRQQRKNERRWWICGGTKITSDQRRARVNWGYGEATVRRTYTQRREGNTRHRKKRQQNTQGGPVIHVCHSWFARYGTGTGSTGSSDTKDPVIRSKSDLVQKLQPDATPKRRISMISFFLRTAAKQTPHKIFRT